MADTIEGLKEHNRILKGMLNKADEVAANIIIDWSRTIGRVPKPIPEGWLEEQYKVRRMIRKADLKDGAWYFGRCRNAQVAQWDAKHVVGKSEFHKRTEGVFVHWREKFGNLFVEEINHPADDDDFDVFWPVVRIHSMPRGVEDIRRKRDD